MTIIKMQCLSKNGDLLAFKEVKNIEEAIVMYQIWAINFGTDIYMISINFLNDKN